MVGQIADDAAVAEAAATAYRPVAPIVRVHITGDLADDPRAMGMAEDIRVVVTTFLADPPSDPEPPREPAVEDGVRISLPGLPLHADVRQVLAGRIRRLVAERTAGRAQS
jgi:hypothetical protein